MPRFTKHRKTKQYSNEFKTKAVQLSLMDGVQVQEVAQTLDIHPFILSRWRKEYRDGVIMADKRKKVVSLKKDINELTKLQQLQKENARLKQENDLLKKWQRFLAEERGIDLDSSSDTDRISE